MDRLILACVPADTPLPDALDKMRPSTRAIVVARPDGRHLIVTAGDIMSLSNDLIDLGVNPKMATVGMIRPVRVPVVPKSRMSASPVSVHSTDLRMNTAEESYFDNAFKEWDDRRYAIQQTGSDRALVVTASETFAGQLNRSYTRCTCVGNPVHSFEQEDLVTPGKCNKPHAVKVNCKTVSGY